MASPGLKGRQREHSFRVYAPLKHKLGEVLALHQLIESQAHILFGHCVLVGLYVAAVAIGPDLQPLPQDANGFSRMGTSAYCIQFAS